MNLIFKYSLFGFFLVGLACILASRWKPVGLHLKPWVEKRKKEPDESSKQNTTPIARSIYKAESNCIRLLYKV